MTDIENLRTLHGGPDSALAVEVSAWRGDGSGGISGGAPLLAADGVAVYIRNPLALHVLDFDIDRPGDDARREALKRAHNWAVILAEHLGCAVEMAPHLRAWLEPAPAPAVPEFDVATLCDAAATLWEAALDLRERASRGDPVAIKLDARWEADGTAAIRQHVANYATACESAWRALSEDEQDEAGAFDWEWVPVWLRKQLERDL